MNNNDVRKFLKKLELSDKEIDVYLFCLRQGPQLMTHIAKTIGVSRTNVYDIIKKLENKGLCHTVGSNYGKRLEAHPPEEIHDLLSDRISEIQELEHELTGLLPFFENQKSSHLSPFMNVSYFEGKDNMKKMIWKSLHARTKVIRMGGSELDIAASLGKGFLIDFHERRVAKKIQLHGIRPDSKRLQGDIFTDDTKYLRKLRKRPKGKIRMKSNIILWDHYIALYSLKDGVIFGTLIENENMAIMLTTWFDLIWEYSEEMK